MDEGILIFEMLFTYIFIYPIILSIIWVCGGLFFAWKNERKSSYEKRFSKVMPHVTILVPCYNEEKTIHLTCNNLRSLDYSNYRVLFIDDGSKDQTSNIIQSYVDKLPYFHLLKMERNCGKASALNNALPLVETPLVLILDADTILDRKALKWLIAPFVFKPNIGAITANVFPKDCQSFWSKVQSSEFASIIGLIKRAQSVWGSIFTVSGCSTLYKTEVLKQIGGFSPFTATEDIDISWRIQRTFNRVLFEPKALAFISVPKSIGEYIKQHKRWVMGGWHLLRQHKNVFKNPKLYRLWMVYIELVLSCFWAFCFTGSLIYLILSFLNGGENMFSFIPEWYGAYASVLYLIQTTIGIVLGYRYNKDLIKSLQTACWYPLIFFVINPALVVFSCIKGLFGNTEVSGRWNSPARN